MFEHNDNLFNGQRIQRRLDPFVRLLPISFDTTGNMTGKQHSDQRYSKLNQKPGSSKTWRRLPQFSR